MKHKLLQDRFGFLDLEFMEVHKQISGACELGIKRECVHLLVKMDDDTVLIRFSKASMTPKLLKKFC